MAELVGILNVTPDSFSDGGAFFSPKAAINAMADMAEQGASVIDIGAESTRPGATPITPEEEWKRLEPVLSALPHFPTVKFSIDTRHAETVHHALKAGVHWVNDVSGFSDPVMVEAVKDSRCQIVLMHSLGVPADKSVTMPESTDVAEELRTWAKERLFQLDRAGIAPDRVILDPGIGFGKTAAQSLALVRDVAKFKALGVKVMVGHSRKSFLNSLPPTGEGNDAATLIISQFLAEQGVDFLRVHDVGSHRKMLDMMKAVHG